MKAAPALACLLLTSWISEQGVAGTAADCDAKGFTGLASCADCDMLAEYVHDEALLADCKACCVKEAADTKYTKAVLEICPMRRSGQPQIDDFVKKHSKKFAPALTVREVPGAYTRLVLSDTASGARTSVRIENWKAATIGEFLRDKLVGGGSSGRAAVS